jgi:hypothetical protein
MLFIRYFLQNLYFTIIYGLKLVFQKASIAFSEIFKQDFWIIFG